MKTILKPLILAAALCASSAVTYAAETKSVHMPSKSTRFQWKSDLNGALESAKTSNKPVLLFVFRDGCPACADIAKRIAKNPFIQGEIGQFEYVALDVESAAKSGYSAVKTPTFFFMDEHSGQFMDPLEGSPKDDYEFLDYLTKIEVAYRAKKTGIAPEPLVNPKR